MGLVLRRFTNLLFFIIGEIKAARVSRLGHMERIGEDQPVKRLGQPLRRQPVGRPRYYWKDEVAKDMIEVPDWSKLAQNRKEWQILMSEAKTRFGSLSYRSK
ncbi:unnamed protein product [Arctia plantaginis]|uniref:Uncharacterized protein n=1 Tax=Arctia plantaginis TaxID=874455 RepID=A0A8S1BFU3_ARCPL|nr:unnamed protein product [Arctia plantaginis]